MKCNQIFVLDVDKFSMDFGTKISYAPEYFAKVTCTNLGLPFEMEPVIAHAIRESIYRYKLASCTNLNID